MHVSDLEHEFGIGPHILAQIVVCSIHKVPEFAPRNVVRILWDKFQLWKIPMCSHGYSFPLVSPSSTMWRRRVATLLWESVRMKLTLPKWGLGSPLGLLKVQSSIARVKTPCIGAFFISLERYWSLNVQNGFTWPIWASVTQVMAKRKAGNQIANLIPTTESPESTRSPCVQVVCNTSLESFRRGLQL
jgi:hypothetical protein